MKTAIQEACNEILEIPDLIDQNISICQKIIHIMHKHLETEKNQIIEAYNDGYFYGINPTTGHKGKDYYEETFKII